VIIKGNIRTDGSDLADYLLSEGKYEANREKNEHIQVWEATGIEQGDSLQNILEDFEHSAAGTKCEKPLFHVQMRNDKGEYLTREQWIETVNRLEERLKLTDHERVIVTHTLEGQEHVHVAWNRIDHEQQKAAELHYYKHKCTDLAREMEFKFCLRELSNERGKGKLSRDEEEQALRHGKNPQEIKTTIRDCWQQSDNGQSFAAALRERGYLLANGDRRDFVILDDEGGVYSVARATGSKAAQVRAKLADLDRENLPSVAEGKQIQLDRATVRDQLQWENELAKAAIEKADREERELKQRQTLEPDLAEEKRAARLGATLYDRANMVEMNRDAMRHLKDVHRHQERTGTNLKPMHPDEHQAVQEGKREPQREEGAKQSDEARDPAAIRRDRWQEFRELKDTGRDQRTQAREDKKGRTEQTEAQVRKAAREAMREEFSSNVRESLDRSNEDGGRERELEQERE
jgi:hypothetical protein